MALEIEKNEEYCILLRYKVIISDETNKINTPSNL